MAIRSYRRSGTALAIVGSLIAVAVAGLRGRVARFEVVENSMLPALRPGDYVIAVTSSSPGRGDIVVYPDPSGSGRDFIKRVVGLPGERIAAEGGQVAIGGEVLAEPWADGPTLPDAEWDVPEGSVLVLGDNRALSSGDSRTTGPVHIERMYRVVWRYWPLGSIGRL